MKKRKLANLTRLAILGIILGVTMLINYLHLHGGEIYPSVHAVCPVGGLENLWAWIAGRGNLQKLFSGTMTLFFFTLVFALVFGRAFCGNICPFGALQEFIGKFNKNKFVVPKSLDKYLRFGKYIILALVTVMAWSTMTIWISPYDPYTAFAHIWSGSELFAENGIGFAILIIVVVASVFVDRFFCKYLCPAGAMYGVISKLSPTKIKRDNCSQCGACTKVCPMNIEVAKTSTVTSPECIACGQCIDICPSKKAEIKMTFFGKNINTLVFVFATVVIFFGSIFIFDVLGLYQVTVPSIDNVQQSGNYIKISDLRGSMTIEDGAMYTGMELSDFYKIMEIPDSVPNDTRLKEVVNYVPNYDFHVIKASK